MKAGVWVAIGVAILAGVLVGRSALHRSAPTGRTPQFENAQAKVWRTRVAPGNPLPLHRHEHARIIVALAAGELDLKDQSGRTERHPLEAGRAYWLPAMPPGALHQDVNPGRSPLDLMVIELK